VSTMQQQVPPMAAEARTTPDAEDMGAAVEAQMGKIVTELGAALGVLLISLGIRSGLWAALADAGPLTTADVAARVSVERSLVREWLRAQAAGGYLEYDAANETFTLPDAVAAAICYGPGGALVDACATMLSSMGEGFAAFSEAFSVGQGFGWHQRTAGHWHGTDAFTRVALPAELIETAIGAMPGVAAVLAAGGTVADVGGAGPGHRLPRRLDCPLPRRGRPQRRQQRAVRGRGRGRPARQGLRPDHLLRLPARPRRRSRRAGTSPCRCRAGRSGAAVRAAGR
jgi:hypothetical protein